MSTQSPGVSAHPPRHRFGLRAILSGFTVIALAATVIVGAVSLWGRSQAAKAAVQTFVAKDVTADILPLPMYLIEMRLVLSQIIEGTLPPEQARAEFKRLQGEYQDRVKYWKANLPFGLEAQLLGAQHTAAEAFMAAAAREIKSLIGASTERVAQGASLADQTVATMTEEVGSIRRVSEITSGISAANARQNAGIAQIGEAIGHIDQATQRNAAMVEECAAAAANLNDQAKRLAEAVAVFQLGRGEAQRVAVPHTERLRLH